MPLCFRSILFDESALSTVIDGREMPEFFTDLNLDQIIASVTAGRDEYNLKPFFYTPLSRVETIYYRYEILRDLENRCLFGHIGSFAQKMRAMRDHLTQADKLHYKYQKQCWFLEAADIYCSAVICLTRDLTLANPRSRGLLAFREEHRRSEDQVPRVCAATGRNAEDKGRFVRGQILPPPKG